MSSKRTLPDWDWVELLPTTCADHVRVYATRRVANWNKSNSCSAMFQSKQQSDTWDANSASAERLTTGSASSRTLDRHVRAWQMVPEMRFCFPPGPANTL
jgi:hypothetical protein